MTVFFINGVSLAAGQPHALIGGILPTEQQKMYAGPNNNWLWDRYTSEHKWNIWNISNYVRYPVLIVTRYLLQNNCAKTWCVDSLATNLVFVDHIGHSWEDRQTQQEHHLVDSSLVLICGRDERMKQTNERSGRQIPFYPKHKNTPGSLYIPLKQKNTRSRNTNKIIQDTNKADKGTLTNKKNKKTNRPHKLQRNVASRWTRPTMHRQHYRHHHRYSVLTVTCSLRKEKSHSAGGGRNPTRYVIW